MSGKAVIVIDMVHDFVTGSLGSDRARAIIQPVRELVEAARNRSLPVIYTNDSHHKDLDRELLHWGPHAVAGSAGARVVDELKPTDRDFVVEKRRYSAFFQTDLHLLLRELDVDTLILVGLTVDICVRHTAADAFFWGFKLIVPADGTQAFTEDEYRAGLDYLARIYGARITSVREVIGEL